MEAHGHVAPSGRCAYCSDEAEYVLAGLPYCPRCALRYVILAMQAEVAEVEVPRALPVRELIDS